MIRSRPLFMIGVVAVMVLISTAALAPALPFTRSSLIITGRVTSTDGAPLPGARVSIAAPRAGTVTDSEGRYVIRVEREAIAGDSLAIDAAFIGFERSSRQVAIDGDTLHVDFTMAPMVLSLDKMVVTGMREPTTTVRTPFTVSKVGERTAGTAPPNMVLQGKVAGGTLLTLAKDVKLQVEFNPATVAAYRLIGYENRLLRAEDFDDDSKDAGELGAGHAVTAFYELIPVGAESEVELRGMDPLRYRRQTQPTAATRNPEVGYVKLRYKQPDADESVLLEHVIEPPHDRVVSTDFTFASAVAAFGLVLRDSDYRGSATIDQVIDLARDGMDNDLEGYRADFIRLAETVRRAPWARALTEPEDRHREPGR